MKKVFSKLTLYPILFGLLIAETNETRAALFGEDELPKEYNINASRGPNQRPDVLTTPRTQRSLVEDPKKVETESLQKKVKLSSEGKPFNSNNEEEAQVPSVNANEVPPDLPPITDQELRDLIVSAGQGEVEAQKEIILRTFWDLIPDVDMRDELKDSE